MGEQLAKDRLIEWHNEMTGTGLDGAQLTQAMREIGMGSESTTEAR